MLDLGNQATIYEMHISELVMIMGANALHVGTNSILQIISLHQTNIAMQS